MKYSKSLTDIICKSLENGCTAKATCLAAGISEETFYKWMKKSEFSEAIKKSQATAINVVETALLKMATGTFEYTETHEEQILVGEKKTPAIKIKTIRKTLAPPVSAIVFYLANRHPEEWKNIQETKLSGTVTGEIKAEDISKVLEELKKEEKAKEKKTDATNSRIKPKGKK